MRGATDAQPGSPVGCPLIGADRAALADAFGALEPLAPGLAARLVGYVKRGNDCLALNDLTALGPEACKALKLKSDIQRRGDPPDERPAWRRWLVEARRHDIGLLLRLVRVVTTAPLSQPHNVVLGRVFHIDPTQYLRPLDPPEWLEPLLWEFCYRRSESLSQSRFESRLPAAMVEDLLRADGYPADLLYRMAFPVAAHDPGSLVLMMVGGLVGYGERLLRQPEIVRGALARPTAKERVRALEVFQMHGLPVGPFLDALAGLAVCPARTVREVAAPLAAAAGDDALPALLVLAESGSSDERFHAVQAISRIGSPEAVAVLRKRSAAETSDRVKAALSDLLSGADEAGAEALPPIDVFRSVSLPAKVKDALAVFARVASEKLAGGDPPHYFGRPVKPVDPDTLERGFALLVQPTPWDESPEPIWPALRWVAPDAFLDFLRRPELTPLHAIRLLCLTGDLRLDQHRAELIYFDYEKPLKVYRDSHEPPLDLRTLGAAFQASALDDLLIARQRLQHEYARRFDWPDEATWPYFAEHFDWLETAFAASPDRRFDYGLSTQTQRRQEVLAILAMFPTPPPRLVGILWGAALGASKAERPMAQRCLEKLPDTAGKVVAALAGGRQESRIAAAEWVARLRPEGAADALNRALGSERSDAVRNALIDAFGKLGASPSNSAGATPDPRRAGGRGGQGVEAGHSEGARLVPIRRLARGPLAGRDRDGRPRGANLARRAGVEGEVARARPDPPRARRPLPPGRRSTLRRVRPRRLARPRPAAPFGARRPEANRRVGRHVPTHPESARVRDGRAGRHPYIHQPEGNATADKGILALAAACGSETAATKIRSYLDTWYGTRVHSCRALVQMLAWVDRPDAVETLLAVSKRFRTKSIRQEAETQARRLAERKGLTLAELADQALPDLGLDAEGRLILDQGGRQFVARLDDDAEVVIEDESGHRLASLPAPRKADDPEKVEHAKKALAELKKRAKALRKTVSERLYEAMCTQRVWRFADWRSTLQAHPIAGRLCRRLVWSVEDGPTFRPLDDGTLSDAADAEVRVEPGASVRLAHALTVAVDEACLWRTHLADYEVSPPFDQFPSDPFRLPDHQRGETRLEAAVSGANTRASLQRLTRGRGYDPLAFRYEDGGNRQVKHFPGAGLQAVLDIDLDGEDDASARSLTLSFLPAGGEAGGRPTTGERPLGEVPPALLSECRADLMAVAGAAGNQAD